LRTYAPWSVYRDRTRLVAHTLLWRYSVIVARMIARLIGAAVLSVAVSAAASQAPAPAPAPSLNLEAVGPQVGARVPSFTLPDQSGQPRSLESLLGPKGAMLVFFRSADW